MGRRFIIFWLLVLVVLALSCSNNSENKELIVGTSITLAPFTYYDDGSNEPVGFDIDIAEIIAKEFGRELKIELMPFQELLQAVDDKKIDMAISLLAITDERKNIVDFSDVYFSDDTIVLVKKSDIEAFEGIDTKEGLRDKKLSTLSGTLLEEYALEIASDNEPLIFNMLDLSVEALLEGEVDGVIITTLGARGYMSKYSELMILPNIEINSTKCGVAVKKGNNRLLKEVNRIMKKLINSGEYANLVQKYML